MSVLRLLNDIFTAFEEEIYHSNQCVDNVTIFGPYNIVLLFGLNW